MNGGDVDEAVRRWFAASDSVAAENTGIEQTDHPAASDITFERAVDGALQEKLPVGNEMRELARRSSWTLPPILIAAIFQDRVTLGVDALLAPLLSSGSGWGRALLGPLDSVLGLAALLLVCLVGLFRYLFR